MTHEIQTILRDDFANTYQELDIGEVKTTDYEYVHIWSIELIIPLFYIEK